MSKHTELPWYLYCPSETLQISSSEEHGHHDAVVFWTGFDAGDRTFSEKKANAEFIVKACNSHYELIEALKDIKGIIEQNPSPHGLKRQIKYFDIEKRINVLLKEISNQREFGVSVDWPCIESMKNEDDYEH